MTSEAATPEASGTPMDLIGKTVRWEHGSAWFTSVVREFIPTSGVWICSVVDPGTFQFYKPGDEAVFAVRRFVTVIDSEPVTEDEECE